MNVGQVLGEGPEIKWRIEDVSSRGDQKRRTLRG